MNDLRLMPMGVSAILAQAANLQEALALLDQLQSQPLGGIVELIPAARTVLVQFDPYLTSMAELSRHLRSLDITAKAAHHGRQIEIPVQYDGEDLGWLAQHLRISVAQVIEKHQAARFTAAFSGFAPGFCYLQCSDPDLHVPRRDTPRLRIQAGSVALAGEFGGIYPSDSPGGWQILGKTPLKMWDLERAQPALIAPGDVVRFRDIAKGAKVEITSPPPKAPENVQGSIRVLLADRPVLMQDLGRAGLALQGVSRAGALDRGALRAANSAVGNPRNEPALEITFGGFALQVEEPLTFALAGAPCAITITQPDGQKITQDSNRPIALNAGDILSIGAPSSGVYSYLALRGGYRVAAVLGSASYDSLAKLGPAPLEAGAKLAPAHNRALAIGPMAQPALPRSGDEVILDVIEGPRDDWFTAQGLASLYSQSWLVGVHSSRSGKRLSAPQPLERKTSDELASEGSIAGAIQVPHSGQPVLFLADHPLTGGYPVIAVVAPHHLDLAAQIPPNAKIKFRPYAKS